jgi:hypothetical protein
LKTVIKRGRSLYKEQKCKWWIFTNLMRKSTKCEFDNGQMNGFPFIEVIRLFEPKNILWVKKQKNGIW